MRHFFVLALTVLVSITPNAFAQEEPVKSPEASLTLGVILFPGFELLDAMGPLEMFGNVGKDLKIAVVADTAGEVASYQKVKCVADYGFDDCPDLDILLVPGGFGALGAMKNERMIAFLQDRAAKAKLTTSVCNGAQILGAAGLLDGKRATTNKQYFSQIAAGAPAVHWVKEARWVEDGNTVTSSGVSAGMDMALAIIAKLFGEDRAEAIAIGTEYEWHRNPDIDPFAKYAR